MRRLGRYPLAVMAWVAVYAGWSSLLGLVVAAVTGERLDDGDQVGPTVGLGVSTLFTVLVPLVPTLVTLWFNDWLRDGAPSRADRARQLAATEDAAASRGVDAAASGRPAVRAPADREPVAPVAPIAPAPVAHAAPAPQPPPAPAAPRVVPPAALGVPELAQGSASDGGFPVARVLRDAETAPAAPLASPRRLVPPAAEPPRPQVPEPPRRQVPEPPRPEVLEPPRPPEPAVFRAVDPVPAPAAPGHVPTGTAPATPPPLVIDPDDPLGVGDLGLSGLDRG